METLNHLIPPALILRSKVPGSQPIYRLTQHSQGVQAGDLFFAVPGTKTNGHQFVPAVTEKGIVAVVEDPAVFEQNLGTLLVKSVREALAVASSNWFKNPSEDLSLVGLTGTNGKTTSTYLFHEIWKKQNIKSGVIGTVQTLIGDIPLPSELTTPGPYELQALLRKMVENQCSHAVMEVSSIALDQYRTAGTEFSVGLFTNLTQDHLDYHGSFENYRSAKLKFFQEYKLKHAVFNSEDPAGTFYYEKCKAQNKVRFALNDPNAEYRVIDAEFTQRGTKASIQTPKKLLKLQSPLIGRYNLYNCLGVLAGIDCLGLDLEKAVEALKEAKGAPGRLERVMKGEEYPSIFVDYAHSDDALLNVLTALSALKGKSSAKIITVFGCGGDRDRTKRPKMAAVVSGLSDVTIVTSDNPRTEDPDAIIDEIMPGILREKTQSYREVNRKKAIHMALEIAEPQDLVLVAGKGHETYQIVGTEKLPFDDSAVIREYYQLN